MQRGSDISRDMPPTLGVSFLEIKIALRVRLVTQVRNKSKSGVPFFNVSPVPRDCVTCVQQSSLAMCVSDRVDRVLVERVVVCVCTLQSTPQAAPNRPTPGRVPGPFFNSSRKRKRMCIHYVPQQRAGVTYVTSLSSDNRIHDDKGIHVLYIYVVLRANPTRRTGRITINSPIRQPLITRCQGTYSKFNY